MSIADLLDSAQEVAFNIQLTNLIFIYWSVFNYLNTRIICFLLNELLSKVKNLDCKI